MHTMQNGETTMQRYQLATPRLALGTAAVALAATTLAVLVIIPATADVDAYAQLPMVSTSQDAGPGTARAQFDEHQVAAAPCAVQARASEDRRDRKDASL